MDKVHKAITTQWEDNIEMDLKENRCPDINWIHVAKGRDQQTGCCEHGNELWISIKCDEFLDQMRNQ
jgi:hypothetical protein